MGVGVSDDLCNCWLSNRGPPPGNSKRTVAALLARLTRNRAEPIGRINNFGGYAFRRQRPMIQTKLVIIATTLNTIRYSILLHSLRC
jgi:hypothetical protein